ncbi:serine hydrolase domain-containing protein [Rhodalgimonas zhirmunskyi]|uniref:Beta-lactamase family protein n=1 Tax=Rhodalgimonas zhirmunskyi TaxID=2964767 RepID=A0AAJ1UDD6_9RHOB|nr:serine hydrolase [Rhodoalgimonas zhirmunskyi]MDQ2094361.1 beta-lactamase family protein [Rhodoalgimonas zhirmunskyi]
MRALKRGVGIVLGIVVVAIVAGYLYMLLRPPELLRVGAGYSSKIICSSTYVSGRDPEAVLQSDVQAPGNPILRLFSLSNDSENRLVQTAFLRFIAPVTSASRPGLGCVAVPDGDLTRAQGQSALPAPGAEPGGAIWPEGEGVDLAGHEALAAVLADDTLAGPGMRGIVVVRDGQIVAERYGEGFDPVTPQLGWSMAKTVTAALVGTVVGEGKLSLDQTGLLPMWEADDRAKITLAQLLSMSSGLTFNENYGDVSDVTRMLYLSPDMAGFAASQELEHDPGTMFSYSSGTTVILSRIWQNALGQPEAHGGAHNWPRTALFDPLGMKTAVFETDAAGTFVGSSYLYASPRDWARFGLFLMRGGVWNGARILPEGWVQMMITPSQANPAYGKGQVWMAGPVGDDLADKDAEFGIPGDAYWLRGHDGQTVAVIPSARVVVVRMGLTPSHLNYRPQRLVAAVLDAIAQE